jgi:hypothetical protein
MTIRLEIDRVLQGVFDFNELLNVFPREGL